MNKTRWCQGMGLPAVPTKAGQQEESANLPVSLAANLHTSSAWPSVLSLSPCAFRPIESAHTEDRWAVTSSLQKLVLRRLALRLKRRPCRLICAVALIFGGIVLAPVCYADTELRISTYASWFGFDSLGERDSAEEFSNLRSPLLEQEFLDTSSSVSGSTYSAGGPGSASMTAGYGYLFGTTNVGSTAGEGFVGVLIDPTAGHDPPAFGGSHEHTARGEFRDDAVIISAPGMSGPGVFTAHFAVDSALRNDTRLFANQVFTRGFPGAFATASIRLNIKAEEYFYEANWVRFLDDNGNYEEIKANTFPDNEVQVQVAFLYDEPFRIRGRARLESAMDASSFQLAQGRVTAEFPTGFHWKGISGLPADATVRGMIDWSKPAPTPTAGNTAENGATNSNNGNTSSNNGGGGAVAPYALFLLLGTLLLTRKRSR